MDEMWDETETEECRQKFIKSVYKFPKMPSVKLQATGQRMPMLGMGSWRAGNAQDTVESALRSGIRSVCQSVNQAESDLHEVCMKSGKRPALWYQVSVSRSG